MSTTPTNFPRVTQSLLTQLADIRARHDRFQRLLADRPTGIRVTTRSKNPEFDLKPGYLRRLVGCCAISLSAILIDLPALSDNRLLAPPEEEEALAFWKVEEKPELVEQVAPTYPPLARKVDLEGTVYINHKRGDCNQDLLRRPSGPDPPRCRNA